jgi:WD40 repeat protein
MRATILFRVVPGFALGLLLAGGLGGGRAQQPPQPGADKLPPGALSRQGTVRWRHGSRILALAYSPNGKVLAAAGGDDPVRLWNTETGQEIRTLPETWVHALAFSPDGRFLAAAGGFKDIRVWDANTGQEVTKLKGHTATVKALAFAPNGNFLVSAGQDRTLRLWNTQGWQPLGQLPGHQDEVTCLTVSPDSKLIASGSIDHTVRFWPVPGNQVRVADGGGAVYGVAFLDGGKVVASAGDDGKVHLWNTDNGQEIRSWKVPGDMVMALAVDRDGKRLIASSLNGKTSLWNENGEQVAKVAVRPGDSDALAVSPDGKTLARAGRNNVIRLWDLVNGKELNEADGPQGGITGLAVSGDGKLLAYADSTETVCVVARDTGKQVQRWTYPSDGDLRVQFSPDGKYLAAAGREIVMLWNVTGGDKVHRWATPAKDSALSVAFSPKGNTLAVGYRTGGVQLYHLPSGKPSPAIPVMGEVHALAFSPDGKVLAAAGLEGITLCDPTAAQLQRQFSKDHPAAALAFSPNGNLLASGHYDSIIRLWNPKDGSEVLSCPGHLSTVYAVAFSPSGRLLTSASFDRTVCLWEVANGQQISTWKGHAGPVYQAAMSADGRQSFSAGADAAILTWDATGMSPGGQLPSIKLPSEQLEKLWTELASASPNVGHKAVWTLIASGKDGVEMLHKRVFLVDRVKVEKLIVDLNANKFSVREKAMVELAGFGQWIRGRLEEASRTPASLEVKLRLDELLEKLKVPGAITLEQERVRLKRVMEVLEQVRSPRCRELLVALTRGAVETNLADEALASLRRVDAMRR